MFRDCYSDSHKSSILVFKTDIHHFEEMGLSMTLENIVELRGLMFSEIVARSLVWLLYSFLTQIFLLWVFLEKEYMKHDMKTTVRIVSRSCFVGTQAWLVQLPCSFLTQIFLQLVVLKKEYRMQNW